MIHHSDLIQQAAALMQQAEALRRQEIRSTALGFLEKMAADKITIADLRDVAKSIPPKTSKRGSKRVGTAPDSSLSALTPRIGLSTHSNSHSSKVVPPKATSQGRKKNLPEHANCAECNKALQSEEISFCSVFSSRFGGRMVCREHQGMYPA